MSPLINATSRPRLAHLTLLLLLCALTYFIAPTGAGLRNWQESQRLMVAREMQQKGEWLAPTLNGRPYLAKPPGIYWAARAVAMLTGGGPVELIHLRLTVALFGTLGVVVTYLAARRLLEDDTAALWSALMLATGFLYVRSSRIGELDILLVAPTVSAVWAIFAAWRTHEEHARTNFAAVGVAALCACFAVMVKGPPALVTIMVVGYGGIALWTALRGPGIPGPFLARAPFVLPIVLAGMFAGVSAKSITGAGDLPGVLCFGLIGAGLGWLIARLLPPTRAWSLFRAYARTHPVGIPLVAGAVFWLWGRVVANRLGADAAALFASEELDDNLRVFMPGSPLNNLEAAAFGVGLGSVAAILTLAWFVRERPRFKPGWFFVLMWVVGGLAAFSLFGKGVGRYLTPLWPGIAMLGGIGVAELLRRRPWSRTAPVTLGACVLALALGQAWYYAQPTDRSPEAFVRELLGPEHGIDPAAIATLEFRTPAVDYYAGRPIRAYGDIHMRESIAGLTPRPLESLVEDVRKAGRPVLLARESAVESLRAMGLRLRVLKTNAVFKIDGGRSSVVAVQLEAPAPAVPPGTP